MKDENLKTGIAGWHGLLCALLVTGSSVAADRQVVVNGKLLDPAALEKMDRADCRKIPDGRYRHDDAKGIWGPADGSKPWRRLGENCRRDSRPGPAMRSVENESRAGSSPEATPPRREEPITGTSPLMRKDE